MTVAGGITTLASFSQKLGYIITPAPVSWPNGRTYSAFVKSEINVGFLWHDFSVASTPGQREYSRQHLSPGFTQNLPDGALFGRGANASNAWHLVKSDPEGNVTSLAQFPAPQTVTAAGRASDGSYYAATTTPTGYQGPPATYVYRVSTFGSPTQLYAFPINVPAQIAPLL